MEIKQNTSPIKLVLLVDSTDSKTGITGVTNPTIYYTKNGGVATQLTTPTWSEIDAVNMPGLYKLTLSTSMTDTLGELAYYVSATNTDIFRGKYQIVANIESDTKAVVDLINSKTTNLPSDPASNTTVNQIPATVWSVSTRTLSLTGLQEIANYVWGQLTTNITTPSSIGKWIKDNLNATITSRSTQTSVNNIPTSPLMENDIRLDNLDAKVSTRSTLTASDVWNYVDRKLTSFGTLLSDIISGIWNDSNRTLTQSVNAEVDPSAIWNYTGGRTLTSTAPSPISSAGIGQYDITFQINQDNLPSNEHYVRLYNIDKLPIFETQSGLNGQVVFYLDAGEYYYEIFKGGTWTISNKITVTNSDLITVNTSSSTISGYATFSLIQLNKTYKYNINEKANFAVKVKCNEGEPFTISSATYEVNDGNSIVATNNCIPQGDTVYFVFNPLNSAYYSIKIKVNIGVQEIIDVFTIDVS